MNPARVDKDRAQVRTPEYVQKVRVPVRLSQPDQDPRDGWLLLFPQVEGELRTESLLELLNSQRCVIPFIPSDEASVVLVTRLNIDWVVIASGIEASLIFPPGGHPTRAQRAEMLFMDQRRLEVAVQWCTEDETSRLSDFLNTAADFVTARAGFGTLIVNKHRLREIRIPQPASRGVGSNG